MMDRYGELSVDLDQYDEIGKFYPIISDVGEDLSGNRFREGVEGIAELRLDIEYGCVSSSKLDQKGSEFFLIIRVKFDLLELFSRIGRRG